MADIALKRARGGIKSRLTRFRQFIDAFRPNEGDQLELKARLEKAEEFLTEFNACHDKFEALDINEALAKELEDETTSFESLYFPAIAKARRLIAAPGNFPNEASNTTRPQSNNEVTHNNVKIPTIALPHFDGSYEKWNHFFDLFKALVHADTSLSNVQKFYYLQSVLKDKAAQVIHSIEVTGENYPIALELLKNRFENKRLTTRHHVRALFDLPPVAKESAGALRALSDELCKNLRALKNLGEPVESWNTLLVELVISKLDAFTKREWEQKVISENFATVEHLTTFLSNKCQMLEAVQQKREGNSKPQAPSSKQKSEYSTSHLSSQDKINKSNCPMCHEDHRIYQCPKVRDLAVSARINEIKRLNLCLNCLGRGHTVKTCKSGSCKRCDKKHNSLLHLEDRSDNAQQGAAGSRANHNESVKVDEVTSSVNEKRPIQSVSTCSLRQPSQVLLSTAIIHVEDHAGNRIEARALLDSGSQSNFMSRALCDRLNLPRRRICQLIGAIGQSVTHVSEITSATIKSRVNAFSIKLSFSILNEITDKIPLRRFDERAIKIPNHVVLADPFYHVPQNVDLLLGAGVFWDLVCVEQIRRGKDQPVLQKTKLGWIVGGPYAIKNQQASVRGFCGFSEVQLQDQLQRFWEIEDIQPRRTQSYQEVACERDFQQTHRRLPSGRFEVRLPFREDPSQLGESYDSALKRLRAMERKFTKQPLIKARYTAFMEEYENLGHMCKIKEDESDVIKCYLPHHAVINEEKSTTKLRVVFDGSNRTTSGKALNDILMAGPVIQPELVDILVRFQQHAYVMTADIVKMYRQVSVNPRDRDLQRILWRTDVNAAPAIYRLNTLTYGIGPASFLATRCLAQLSIDNVAEFLEASEIIKRDFYVDDLITGASSVAELKRRKAEITEILQSASFPLQKWNSNSRMILEEGEDGTSSNHCSIGKETKILGLYWNTNHDHLHYQVADIDGIQRPTKRAILSFVAQLFDPLGLIGPTTIKAKILLQRLWQLQLSWDEGLPLDIHTKWIKYQRGFAALNQITIPRHALGIQPVSVELHGFCDASTVAYGACVYLKSTNSSGSSNVRLLCAKSRVAPLRPVTLPRLELCGALLLSQLYRKVKAAITIKIDSTCFWCDSSVALAWIKGQPHQWKEFVRNRVTEIQDATDRRQWRHVRSEHNPADIISRGTDPEQLLEATIWWHGPSWLENDEATWPVSACPPVPEVSEARTSSLSFSTIAAPSVDEFCTRYSSLRRLRGVIAYMYRFSRNIKAVITGKERQLGPLTVEELQCAMDALVRLAQQHSFDQEFIALKNRKPLHRKSRLFDLYPFVDKNEIIRVGGRLRNAPLPYDKRFPIVLPAKHPLTKLIILHFHHRDLHAGPSAILASIREQYWILSARNAVRSVLRKCMVCFRLRPISPTQLMGDLPADRTTPSRPFTCVGVDYAGPYTVKISRNKTAKAYLCLFVCLATKAVHLELVSDMTTSGFLNSLKRFIVRRGRCKVIYSDNGTNLVGAHNVMQQWGNLLTSKAHQERVSNYTADQFIEWKFIPPHSPHVGGLWESNIKSAKTHAKAVIGDTSLTFEELCTVFTQIEACLNSRPLVPLSPDPSDLEVLTPGHFLIGSPLTALPEGDVADVASNRLTRYELVTKLQQDFWRRWSREYVAQLQQRKKWKSENVNEGIKIGAMVLLRENTPPLQWRLGRITEVHPGRDGLIRIVTIRTQSGTVQRTLPKLCVLPIA